MSQFDDRERAAEAKFALDNKIELEVMARRNKMLGLWAADLMGKIGDEAEAYAKSVVISDLEEAGEDDVFRKIRDDLEAAGVDRSDTRIREQMAELLLIAREQVIKKATS